MSKIILLTWNPKQGRPKHLAAGAKWTQAGEVVYIDWSMGSRKNILPGTRCFLMRQGQEPKGIVGAGYVVTKPEHAPDTPNTHYAMVAFTMLLDADVDSDAILPRSLLQSDKSLSGINVDAAGGGIEVNPVSCGPLEEKWKELLEELGLTEVSVLTEWIRQGQEYWDNGQYSPLDEEDEEDEEEVTFSSEAIDHLADVVADRILKDKRLAEFTQPRDLTQEDIERLIEALGERLFQQT
jgi:hypothetical protein